MGRSHSKPILNQPHSISHHHSPSKNYSHLVLPERIIRRGTARRARGNRAHRYRRLDFPAPALAFFGAGFRFALARSTAAFASQFCCAHAPIAAAAPPGAFATYEAKEPLGFVVAATTAAPPAAFAPAAP